MKQYIEKPLLVAEIEKMRDKAYPNSDWNHGYVTSCEKILSFIDTLELKEVDLDAAVEHYIEEHKSELNGYFDLRRIARHFFELGLKAQKGE